MHEMQEAFDIRLRHEKRIWQFRIGQEGGVRAKIDTQVIALRIFEPGAEARQQDARRSQLPIAFELPQVPLRLELRSAIGCREFLRQFQYCIKVKGIGHTSLK
jgi:hypothetical protein